MSSSFDTLAIVDGKLVARRTLARVAQYGIYFGGSKPSLALDAELRIAKGLQRSLAETRNAEYHRRNSTTPTVDVDSLDLSAPRPNIAPAPGASVVDVLLLGVSNAELRVTELTDVEFLVEDYPPIEDASANNDHEADGA